MKKASFYAIAIGLTLAFALTVSEVLLRANGFVPWTPILVGDEPTFHEPHDVLGWRARAGRHVVPAYDGSANDIVYTFREDGRRAAGAATPPDSGAIVLVGGSYTQGFAISDDETWAWRLQERFPDRSVLNWGTAGYGAYQSLLVLEEQLPRLDAPRVVVYGLNDHHELRNVAPARWLRALSRFSQRGHVDTPFATLDASGGLVRHPPERYLALPLHEHLATVAFAERVVMDRRTAGRGAYAPQVMEAILTRMRDVCRENGASFVVAVLRAKPAGRRRYRQFLEGLNVRSVDCVFPLPPELRVAGETHPNGRVHGMWADRVAPVLADLITPTP